MLFNGRMIEACMIMSTPNFLLGSVREIDSNRVSRILSTLRYSAVHCQLNSQDTCVCVCMKVTSLEPDMWHAYKHDITIVYR